MTSSEHAAADPRREDATATRPDIPFARPSIVGNELEYMRDSIARGHISGDGFYTSRCEALLSRELADARVLLTTSGTHALELAALLLDIGPGDEVIVPSFTFVSTANAFALRGARIVFADIRPDTLNLDERLLESLITSRTKAVVPVHYGGVACAMEEILACARGSDAAVVEDAAHALFGRYAQRPLGTFGALAALSFHETKNVYCGEGGALIVNDAVLIERAEVLREKGTDRTRFFRGAVDRYTWLDLGSSWVMADMLAAFLLAQLERREQTQAARRTVWQRYERELQDWAAQRGVEFGTTPIGCTPPHHLFRMLMTSPEQRDALIAHLRRRGVHAVFHYLPLHLSAMGRTFGARPGDCPVTESVSERIVRLPLYSSMSDSDVDAVIAAVREF